MLAGLLNQPFSTACYVGIAQLTAGWRMFDRGAIVSIMRDCDLVPAHERELTVALTS